MRGFFGSMAVLTVLLHVAAPDGPSNPSELHQRSFETSTVGKAERTSHRGAVIDDSEEMDTTPSSSFYVPVRSSPPSVPYSIDHTCNSSELREILVQAISETPSDSKHRINAALTRNMEGSFGVVCAECLFSYHAHTIQYCHHTRNNITCLVYRDE